MWRYQFLILILTPVIVTYTIIRAIKFNDFRYLTQRFCFTKFNTPQQQKPIWIHAASVGEIIAVIPLIQKIVKLYPTIPIQITSNTNTSAEIVRTQLESNPMIKHYYMPIDWKWAIHKIIITTQPRCIFIVETEIWPNLFSSAYKKNIPIVILNARLSHRTTSAKPWLLHLYREILNNVTKILTRSEQDYGSYLKLGAQKSQLKLIGNIKFSPSNNQSLEAISLARTYVLAASTHEDEELQLVSIWMDLIEHKIVTTDILVIVPRHPERTSTILKQIKKLDIDIKVAIRSKKEPITDSTQIYIADTVGELKQFMPEAKFIFMGGSLISHGGQNIIEPAQLAKAIIFGHYMFNFKDECQLLLDNNAAIQVNNKSELYDNFLELLQNPKKITQLSEAAARVIQNKENTILQRYLTEIEKYIVTQTSTL